MGEGSYPLEIWISLYCVLHKRTGCCHSQPRQLWLEPALLLWSAGGSEEEKINGGTNGLSMWMYITLVGPSLGHFKAFWMLLSVWDRQLNVFHHLWATPLTLRGNGGFSS